MAMSRYDPLTRLISFRDAIDRMFEEPWRSRMGSMPTTAGTLPVDIFERQDELIVVAAVPGASPEDVDIQVTGDSLTIRATIRSDVETENASQWTWYAHELDHGTFTRSISLPFPVSTDRADARFENGLLRMTLPKSEEARPKRIQVRGLSGQPQQIGVNQQGS